MTAGELIRRGLAVVGVDAVYGDPLPDVRVVEAEAGVAALLAEAHLLVHRGRCAIHRRGLLTVVERSARFPVADPPVVDVDDGDGLIEVWRVVEARLGSGGPPASGVSPRRAGAVTIKLGLEAGEPVVDRLPALPVVVERWAQPPEDAVAYLAAARSPVALVGPGVADPALVPGLHALAAAGSLGVLNTWGAKGVFHWRSRHHWATVGLQAHDFELGGLVGADLVVVAGLDELEAPPAAWRKAPVLEVAPGTLGPLAERWARPRTELEVPPLRAGLAAVTQRGWAQDTTPLMPTRVTLGYGSAVGPRGLVAADPGTAGYWVARTFATTSLGGAVVPARPGAAGVAAACVAVARVRAPGRPALAVVDGPDLDPASAEVVAWAARLGVAVPVERWHPGGPTVDADAHADRLRRALVAPRSTVLALATDPTQLDRMIDVAGPIVAWT